MPAEIQPYFCRRISKRAETAKKDHNKSRKKESYHAFQIIIRARPRRTDRLYHQLAGRQNAVSPREAKYLFGRRLPFTPGVIPRGKERLGKAMGSIINTQLLTEESIREHLTSDEFISLVRGAIRNTEERLKADDRTFRRWLDETVGEEKTAQSAKKIQDFLTEKAAEKLSEMQIGRRAAGLLAVKIGESLKGSFLGKFVSDSFLQSLVPLFEKMIDDYIGEHGKSLLRPVIEKETDNLLERRISDTAQTLSELEIDREKLLEKLSSDSVVPKIHRSSPHSGYRPHRGKGRLRHGRRSAGTAGDVSHEDGTRCRHQPRRPDRPSARAHQYGDLPPVMPDTWRQTQAPVCRIRKIRRIRRIRKTEGKDTERLFLPPSFFSVLPFSAVFRSISSRPAVPDFPPSPAPDISHRADRAPPFL